MKGDYKNIWTATLCSTSFLGLFIAYNSAQNIQSQVLAEDGFGKLGF
jgi:hypothetical protein